MAVNRIPMALDFIGGGERGGDKSGWLVVEGGQLGAIPLSQSAL